MFGFEQTRMDIDYRKLSQQLSELKAKEKFVEACQYGTEEQKYIAFLHWQNVQNRGQK